MQKNICVLTFMVIICISIANTKDEKDESYKTKTIYDSDIQVDIIGKEYKRHITELGAKEEIGGTLLSNTGFCLSEGIFNNSCIITLDTILSSHTDKQMIKKNTIVWCLI